MRTIETFSRARGSNFWQERAFVVGVFHRRRAGDRADCMRAGTRDLPVRLGRMEAPRGDRGFLRRSVSARPKARDD